MEPVIITVVNCSALIVPALALWAIAALFSQRAEEECYATQVLYFGTLLMVSVVTLRTVSINDACWLMHTATLGVLIVAGALRRPAASTAQYGI